MNARELLCHRLLQLNHPARVHRRAAGEVNPRALGRVVGMVLAQRRAVEVINPSTADADPFVFALVRGDEGSR